MKKRDDIASAAMADVRDFDIIGYWSIKGIPVRMRES
jgi:hypothetical protein